MDYRSPLDNQAARSALVSTGIVGVTATLVQQLWGKGPKVGLPIGIATALALDYAHKRYRNHRSVRTISAHARDLLRDSQPKNKTKSKAWTDRTWYEEQLTRAWVATGGIALVGAYSSTVTCNQFATCWEAYRAASWRTFYAVFETCQETPGDQVRLLEQPLPPTRVFFIL